MGHNLCRTLIESHTTGTIPVTTDLASQYR